MNKIIVQYDQWGRMGNRMFQYAFARILSEMKKCPMHAEPLLNFKNTLNTLPLASPSSNAIYTRNYGSHTVDMNELVHSSRDIVVNSYVQKWFYYVAFQEEIKKWFHLDIENHTKPANDELVIHVRETDYNAIGMTFPAELYVNAVKKLGYSKNTVVTDNFESPIALALKDMGCSILSDKYVDTFSYVNNDNIMRDFIYMMMAGHLLISHSSFSWWAAFLGNHDKVYCPVTERQCMWKKNPGKDDSDLMMGNFTRVELQ
jgi:hypothetical protein